MIIGIRQQAVANSKILKVVGYALCAMLFALCSRVEAQQPGKVFRIGFLDASTASGNAVLGDGFRQEMRKLGWIDGKNITIDYRFAEGQSEGQRELVAELIRLNVDLIVVAGIGPAIEAKKQTSIIPIVMASAGNPVAVGLVASLARPGGNVTGLSTLNPELNTKRLEILKDAVPKLVRVGFLRPSAASPAAADLPVKELRAAAQTLKLNLEEIDTQPESKDLEKAFQTAKQKRWARL